MIEWLLRILKTSNYLAVQWIELSAFIARAQVDPWSLAGELRSHQLRVQQKKKKKKKNYIE